MSRKYYHIITISTSLMLTAVEFGMGAVGRNIIGICSAQTTVWIMLPTIIYGAFFIMLIYTAYFIQKYLSQRSRDLNQREFTYVQHYLGYMVLLCIIIVSLTAVDVDNVLRLNKYIGTPDLENNANVFNNLALTKFILANLSPFFLVVARIRDPAILKPWMDGFTYVICCYWARNSTEEAARDSHLLIRPSEREEREREIKSPLLRRPRLSHLKSNSGMRRSSYEPTPVENTNSKQRNKDPQMFYSIFAGIHYFWYLQKTEKATEIKARSALLLKDKDDAKHDQKLAKEKKKFALHNALLKQNLPNIYREIKNRKYKVRFGIFTSYASNLFNELVEADNISQDLMNSLELVRNFSNIINAESMSKKFQFITYNSRFIIRSISKGERRVLLEILPAYLNHLRTQPYSLLPRIYGLFRFEVLGPYHQVNWLIMKNISEKSGTSIERVYDVRGSGNERIIPNTEVDVGLGDLKRYGLLRDGDFENYEGSIYINQNMKGSLHDAIKQDVNFLTRQNLINYSLMVTIANGTRPYNVQQRLSSSVIIEVEESMEERSMTVGQNSMMRDRLGRLDDEDEKSDSSRLDLSGNRTQRIVSNVSNISNVQIQNPFCNIKSTKENVFYSIEIDNFLLKYDWKRKIIAFCGKCSRRNVDPLLPPDVYGSRFRQYVKKMTLDRGNLIPSVRYDDDEEIESEPSHAGDKETAGSEVGSDAVIGNVNVAVEGHVNGNGIEEEEKGHN